MMFDAELLERADSLLRRCRAKHLTLATAESCTGGLIAAVLTSVSGASEVLDRGFVTYSNQAKSDLLGVDPALIAKNGAVSEAVACAMAEGAWRQASVDLAVSVTGIAGPSGATPTKPVGLVHMAAAGRGTETLHRTEIFGGDRAAVRRFATLAALDLVARLLD